MITEKKTVLFAALVLVTGSFVNYVVYRHYLDTAPFFSTDFHDFLLDQRFWTFWGTLLILPGVYFERRWVKAVSVIGIGSILASYAVWYGEKFDWIRGLGIVEGTPEYLYKVDEIGLLRGSNVWDYVLIVLIIPLFLWLIFRFMRHTKLR